MRRLILSLIWISFTLFVQGTSDAPAKITFEPTLGSVHPPVLMCRAEGGRGIPPVFDASFGFAMDKPIEVSNLIQPRVQIAFHYFETPSINGSGVNLRLLSLREDDNLTEKSPPPNLKVEVYRLENGRRIQVAARWHGFGGERGTRFDRANLSRDPLHELPPLKYTEAEDFYLWIPQEESVRIRNLEAFLRRWGHDSGLTGDARDRNGQMIGQIRSILQNGPPDKRRLLLDYWDQGNESGEYEVVCRYHPRDSDPWQADLTAPPLRIRIMFEASWFDTVFRKLTTSRNPPH